MSRYVIEKRHKWGKPIQYPPGAAEICTVCGPVRIGTIPGYKKTRPVLPNGKISSYCPGKTVMEL